MEFEKDQIEKLEAISVFLLRFAAAGIVFNILILLVPTIIPLQKFFASATALSLEFLGLTVERSGIDVLTSKGWYRITRDCTGWKSAIALFGLSFASKTWSVKLLSQALTLILSVNLVRIVSLIFLDQTGLASFQLVHGTAWRWGLMAVVLGFWSWKIRGTEPVERLAGNSSILSRFK